MSNEMVKILHTSDIQLGRKFPQLGKAGDLVRSAIKESFEHTVKIALAESVDCVIVAGNLFSINLVSRNLIDFALRQIERLGRIPIIVVPGQADSVDETSVYKHLSLRKLPANLTILGLDGNNSVTPSDLGFTVSGVPCGNASSKLPAESNSSADLHILVVPDGVTESNAESSELSPLVREAKSSGRYDYIAVGGMLGFERWSQRVVTSGSPEGIAFMQGEHGRVVLAEISKQDVNLAHREVGKLKWIDLEFTSENYRFTIEVERELQSHVDTNTVLRARFTGQPVRDGFIDLSSLKGNFSEQFCHFIISDEREFGERLIHELSENSSNLVNEFTALVREGYQQAPPELQAGYLSALATGRALLSGKDVM